MDMVVMLHTLHTEDIVATRADMEVMEVMEDTHPTIKDSLIMGTNCLNTLSILINIPLAFKN